MKNSNKKLAMGVLSLTFCMTAAAAQGASAVKDSGQSLTEPSSHLARQKIESEMSKAVQESKTKPVKEALAAVQQTAQAMELLDKGDAKQAKTALEGALGKIDVVLSSNPNVALVPLSADVRIIDLNADEATINKISGAVKDFVKQGRYQPARLLLRDFASEIDLTMVNIPLGSYPAAIRKASALIDQSKIPDARMQLMNALNGLVVTERVLPLPVLRAEALVAEVDRQAKEKKIDKAQANKLLNDANQQLVLAEKLGYGTRKQDFENVLASIKDVRGEINRGAEPQGLLAKIESGLQVIKEKLSRAPASL